MDERKMGGWLARRVKTSLTPTKHAYKKCQVRNIIITPLCQSRQQHVSVQKFSVSFR
jgi:hypothetical protein